MSLEQSIANLTVALQENTAAIKAQGATPAAAPKPAAAAPKPTSAPAAAKSTHTRAEMNAALSEVKEKKGAPAAKSIISDVGGVAKMAEIPDDKIDAVYDSAKAAVAESDNDM